MLRKKSTRSMFIMGIGTIAFLAVGCGEFTGPGEADESEIRNAKTEPSTQYGAAAPDDGDAMVAVPDTVAPLEGDDIESTNNPVLSDGWNDGAPSLPVEILVAEDTLEITSYPTPMEPGIAGLSP